MKIDNEIKASFTERVKTLRNEEYALDLPDCNIEERGVFDGNKLLDALYNETQDLVSKIIRLRVFTDTTRYEHLHPQMKELLTSQLEAMVKYETMLRGRIDLIESVTIVPE